MVALSVEHIDAWADDVIEGLGEGARSWACPALGGDTTRTAGPAHVSVTVLGHAEGSPLRRSGARPGDRILLSGELGRSAQATASLLAGESVPWPRPRPRLDLLGVLGPATAGIDVSDGLLADALHLADASAVALVLDRAALVPAGVPERLALCGGEDYELLVTSPEPLAGFREVGRVERGSGLSFLDGQPLPPAPWGWDHGATP